MDSLSSFNSLRSSHLPIHSHCAQDFIFSVSLILTLVRFPYCWHRALFPNLHQVKVPRMLLHLFPMTVKFMPESTTHSFRFLGSSLIGRSVIWGSLMT